MTNFDRLDGQNSPTSPAQMLERTRRRAEQIRSRRRRALTAIAALGVVLAIAVPVVLASGDHGDHVVGVTAAPSTVEPGPTTTTPPSTASTTVTTNTTAPTIVASTVPAARPDSTTTVTRPAAVPPCASSQLVASLANGSGAAGSVGYDLILRNAGSTTCSLLGYPGVSYVTAAFGTTVGAPARRDALGTVTAVALAPGKTARATVIETDSLNYPPDTCQLTAVAGLRIYPPNQTAPLFVPQSTKACANTNDPVLQVGPVQH